MDYNSAGVTAWITSEMIRVWYSSQGVQHDTLTQCWLGRRRRRRARFVLISRKGVAAGTVAAGNLLGIYPEMPPWIHWTVLINDRNDVGLICGQYPSALGQWLNCLLGKAKITGSNPTLAFKFQRNKIYLPRSLVKIQYCGEHTDQEVACSASDLQVLNFNTCVRRAVSSHSSVNIILYPQGEIKRYTSFIPGTHKTKEFCFWYVSNANIVYRNISGTTSFQRNTAPPPPPCVPSCALLKRSTSPPYMLHPDHWACSFMCNFNSLGGM